MLEQEKIHRLIERLRTEEAVAAAELVQCGVSAMPALVEALERRDVDLRRQALAIIQQILDDTVAFDPYAPETLRRQQVANLRERLDRKAG